MMFDLWPVYSGERFRALGPYCSFFFFLGGGGGGGSRAGREGSRKHFVVTYFFVFLLFLKFQIPSSRGSLEYT